MVTFAYIRSLWKKMAVVQTRMVLSVVYILLSPVMVLLRKPFSASGWTAWENHADTLGDVRSES